LLKRDEINIVRIFDHCLLKRIANSLDFGDIWQIILYFGLYRIKSSSVTQTIFALIRLTMCISFFIRKYNNFL